MNAVETADHEPIFHETTERFLALRLVTEVRADGLHVRLAPLQRSFRHVPPAWIRSATATTYDASTFSGWHWGLRKTPGGTVYRLRGDRGVEVVQTHGDRVFVGSQLPEELLAAIERVRPSAES